MTEEINLPINFFDNIDKIKQKIEGKELIFFLDYDGTLTPIVATPDMAILSKDMREAVRSLARAYKVSIVSGRATDDVKSKVQIEGLFYAGSHGFEIVQPNAEVIINEEAQQIRPIINEAHAELKERLKPIEGALAEHVKYTISAHYRLVDQKDFADFERIVDEVLSEYPMLRKTSGKKVFELRPKVDWHKGKAVQWILNVLAAGDGSALPIYIGDDTTDEDAFAVMKDKGFGILVADPVRESKAEYVIKSTDEVKKVLEYFVDTKG